MLLLSIIPLTDVSTATHTTNNITYRSYHSTTPATTQHHPVAINPFSMRAVAWCAAVLSILSIVSVPTTSAQTTDNRTALQSAPLSQQPTPVPPQFAQALPQAAVQTERVVIESITYTIDGITTEAALRAALPELYQGKVLPNRQRAIAFVEEQKKLVGNLRPIQSSEITYRFVDSNPTQLHLTISVVDSNNIIVLPRPEYNSETGWDISLRFRDYNFAGSLNPLAINLDLKLYEGNDQADTIAFSPQLTIPFEWLDTTWQWNTNLAFETAIATDDDTATFGFDNTLSVNLPFFNNLWTLSYLQGTEFIPANEEQPYYLTSKISFGSSIPFGNIPLFGGVRYLPNLFAEVDYRLDDEVAENIRGFELGYNHRLAFGVVFWNGNTREGLMLAFFNDNTYNFYQDTLRSSIGTEIQGHATLENILAFSHRLGVNYGLPVSDEDSNINDAGDYARGVRDAAANGNLITYFNNDIKLVGFVNGTTLEAQGGIFADGLIATDVTKPFDLQSNVHIGVGVELIGFLLQARSVYIRLSIGFDILDFLWHGDIFSNNNEEIFLGLGHFY